MTNTNTGTKNPSKPTPSSKPKDRGNKQNDPPPKGGYAAAPDAKERSPYWDHRWGLPTGTPEHT